MTKFRNFAAAAALVASAIGFTSAAHAGGWIADTFIRPFSPEAADAADGINRSLGHPVERAGGAIMDYYVPGSGQVAQEIWRQNANGGGGQRFAQQPMGNFCYTQAGRFGPGPMNPLGSYCTANTQWGVLPGQVGQ